MSRRISLLPSASDYRRLDHRQHVYDVPDMYVGSPEQIPREEWLFDPETSLPYRQVISFPRAAEKIFIEILSNASDNVGHSRRASIDPYKIEVFMNSSTVTIRNYGRPIPIEMHPTEGVYVPQLIFGSLLTSSNYNVERLESGRNGIGAKDCNIFSLLFRVKVGDSFRGLLYEQEWRDNMTRMGEPSISPYQEDLSYVEVTYLMDFARFGYAPPTAEGGGYPWEALHLFLRHCVDISHTAKILVEFNGVPYQYFQLKEYARLYVGDVVNTALLHYEWPKGTEIKTKRDGTQQSLDGLTTPLVEMLVADTPDQELTVSFVNYFMTKDGGAHVNAALKAVASTIVSQINESVKKEKGVRGITLADVRPHISLFVSCRVSNPSWPSNAKNMLEAPIPSIVVGEEELRIVRKWKLIDRLYASLEAKQYSNLLKTDGKKKRHIMLDSGVDANHAGRAQSHRCVLYITEGNSGMGYANTLISLVPNGRDYIGVMPMRGKGLNVMNATPLKIAKNKEISELKKMLGLREEVDYRDEKNFSTLRYGGLMIMADSDLDGKHIVGLILVFFHCRFPSLLARGYVMYYRTPILRAFRGKQTVKFYTTKQYENWRESTTEWEKWNPKYYKGLGSSLDDDVADDYEEPQVVTCFYDDLAPNCLSLAFDSKRADERKTWIATWLPDWSVEEMTVQPISAFINHEFIQFSIADLQRNIPALLDGLKTSLRKVLWSGIQRWGLGGKEKKGEGMKVDDFASYVSQATRYHHAGDCLSEVVTKMAQEFVGANNLPYFTREGQFGSRDQGGADAAKGRYTSTRTEWWIPYVFKKEDLPLLTKLKDEGKEIEPIVLLPIIPLGLVNGSNGIGTGHSTFVANHDPLQLISWIRSRLKGEIELPEIQPWYRGFTGGISIYNRKKTLPYPEGNDSDTEEETEEPREKIDIYIRPLMSMRTTGTYHVSLNGAITVTELPIGKWINDYRHWLNSLIEEKKIKDMRDLSTKNKPHFEITGFEGVVNHRSLRLQRSYGLSNMVFLDDDGRPRRYDTAEDVLEEFYQRRLPYYHQRRARSIQKTADEMEATNSKLLFVRAVVSGELLVLNQSKHAVYARMIELGIPEALLTSTSMVSCTEEEIRLLEQQLKNLELQHQALVAITAEKLWLDDLDGFERAYRRHYRLELPKRKIVLVQQ